MKGVAYQQNYNPNGSAGNDVNSQYTDPLADGSACARDIPYMKQIFTNIIRVYAIDPTKNHDDCMAQLASADIYVIADLGQPGVGGSINSDDPSWNVALYQRYTSVVDSLNKYNNVLGFFAGNEVVEKANQTAAAAFVKAAVRDTKAYIVSQNYRKSLGVGYATADVPSRDQLAAYFACEPTGGGTSIDFWGYNVYSWCGDSNYMSSSYGARVDFFSDYPVPVFFAEYGCNENIVGGPTHRPFTEVPVLYGNMTSVFSGGIVYEWFMAENEFGLVSIDSNNHVTPYPDFTSLQAQLKTVSPTITMSSNYKPANTAPACPTTGSTWLPKASPLPPAVNPQLCDCEVAALSCAIKSTDATQYAAVFDYICAANAKFCAGIQHNSTTGTYGAIGGCNPIQQLGFVANQYYLANSAQSSACDFSGVATVQSASTASSCTSLVAAAGTNGAGSVPSPTGAQGTAAASSSKNATPGPMTPGLFDFGKVLFVAYAIAFAVSAIGIVVL